MLLKFSCILALFLAIATTLPSWNMTEPEARALYLHRDSILRHSDILAFYGHPRSRGMGILGRYNKEVLYERLSDLAAEYQEVGGRNVVKAFYIIFGTAQPEGEIGIIDEDLLTEWIEFALERNMLVFIDHQIGRFTPEIGIRRMLPWLRYPNVHLALDPEWRTDRPMQVLGHVTADELNNVQQIMQNYLIENNLPGERFLVIHQFNHIMLRDRDDIRGDFNRIRLVHHISGIGTPTMKRDTYEFGSRAENLPVKGFKLWFDFGFEGHTDTPLMTPQEVMELEPRPYIIMYQ